MKDRWSPIVAWSLVLASLIGFQAKLPAQMASGGSIEGYVTDAQGGAVAGAAIEASSPASSETRRASAGADGVYRLAGLPPGDYSIAVRAPGFAPATRSGIAVREGLNLVLDLTLSIAPVTEAVLVDGDTPMLESKAASVAVNISGDLQERLPLSSLRNWSDFLLLAPGVATSQARFQTYSLYGAGHPSGVYLVDGADATSVLQGSTLYSQFGSGTFADIQVTTGAPQASAPLGLGPIVNVATRSGTDRRQGSAAFAWQPRRWNADNAEGGETLTVETRQSDFTLGGPIVPGRWWFFGSLRVARNQTGNPRSAAQVADLRGLDPAFTQFDNAWRGQMGFLKITGRLAQNTEVTASFSRDVLTLGGAQPNEAGRFRNLVLGGPGYFGRISTVWSSSLMTRVSLGYNGKAQRNENLQPRTTGVQVYQHVLDAGGRVFGVGLLGALNASPFPGTDFRTHMWTFAGEATYYHEGRLGSHELQAGVYLQPHRHNEQITRYNNGGFQLEEAVLRDPDNPAAGFVPFHRQVFDTGQIATTHVDSRDTAVYVQDAWRAARRVTVSAGVRVDVVRRRDEIFGVATQRSVEVGPRLGVNYALGDGRRDALRAAWSRVHENLSVNETRAGTRISGVTDFYDRTGDGTFETAFVSPRSTAASTDTIVDLDRYGQGHVDELVVGYQRQIGARTSVDVSVTRREYRDRPAAVEINGVYDGRRFVGYRDETQNEIYQLTANVWNWPVVNALQAQVAHQASRLQVLAGYTRQWNHLAGTWQPNDPASFIQPEAFANARGIGFVDGCTSGFGCVDANSYFAWTGGEWRAHLGDLAASVQAPWGLRLATNYKFQSGPWSGPILALAEAPDPAFGPPTVLLSDGREVTNPLDTPVRFAYPTREEGQVRLPSLHLWNVRVGRTFAFGGERLDVALDVLNVANNGADQAFDFGGNERFSPSFGRGVNRQFPRAVQLSGRWEF
jgi:hypothetical protein